MQYYVRICKLTDDFVFQYKSRFDSRKKTAETNLPLNHFTGSQVCTHRNSLSIKNVFHFEYFSIQFE